jgi:stalled ribosome rescue protein Dom34
MLEAICSTDSQAELTIISMQDGIGKMMSTKLTTWENKGWVGVHHREILRAIVAKLKAKKARTKFVVAGPGTEAKALCQLVNKTAKTVAACSIVPEICTCCHGAPWCTVTRQQTEGLLPRNTRGKSPGLRTQALH